MRCPWCGSPVRIRGRRWECGYCGDCGWCSTPARSKKPRKTIAALSFSFSYHVDLSSAWSDLKSALETLVPGGASDLRPLLGRVLLHEISTAVQHQNAAPEERKLRELADFLKNTPDLPPCASAGETLRSLRSGVLYSREAELSEKICGTFWEALIAGLPLEAYYDAEPEGLFSLLSGLASVYAYFAGEAGNEMGVSQERRNALHDAFDSHWEKKLLPLDADQAKRLLAQGIFPLCEDICRDILASEFPEETVEYVPGRPESRSWEDLVEQVLSRDPQKGIRMWRTLLDLAAPRLNSDPGTAERLLPYWDALEEPGAAAALLSALEDDVFARQIFQSASVGGLQRDLLSLCRSSGRPELGRRCLGLVLENPHLSESWRRRLTREPAPPAQRTEREGMSSSAHTPPADEPPDDGRIFHYCAVRLPGVRRTYAYLTGGLALKIGDWVEVPFGREALPRRGQVSALTECTRTAAPWPPEQTKTVLRAARPPEPWEELP